MSNRFDADFNNEIRRTVKNFNQKRNRAIRRGFKYLPDKVYISHIKQQFTNRGEIERYLNQLAKFNYMGDSAYEEVITSAGAKTSKYKMEYIRDNLEMTKAFYDRQIAEARKLYESDQFSMARRDYLFNLESKRKELELNLTELTQSQLNAFETYTNRAMDENRININGYRGFLDIVDKVMTQTGVDKQLRKEFFDKMAELSPAQFVKMYRSSDLINRIYEIDPSPEKGQEFNTTDEDAKALVEEMINNIDNIKKEALEE